MLRRNSPLPCAKDMDRKVENRRQTKERLLRASSKEPAGYLATQQAGGRPSFRPTTKHLRFNLPGLHAEFASPVSSKEPGDDPRELPARGRPYLSVLAVALDGHGWRFSDIGIGEHL